MYQKAYGIIETLAPLHVGASAGEETGNLNLIFRDQFTQTGIIPGSSIRGRFRADMRSSHQPTPTPDSTPKPNSFLGKKLANFWYGHDSDPDEIPESNNEGKAEESTTVNSDTTPKPKSKDKLEDKANQKDHTTEAIVKFEYASLLWLPVFCPGQPIVWISCPRLLKRYQRINPEIIGAVPTPAVPTPEENGQEINGERIIQYPVKLKSGESNRSSLFFNLGRIDNLTPKPELKNWMPIEDLKEESLLVVQDTDMSIIHDMALYRQTRTKLKDAVKKVDNFFGFEALPEGSILVFPIAIKEYLNEKEQKQIAEFKLINESEKWQPFGVVGKKDIYLGGLESIGCGRCQVTLQGEYFSKPEQGDSSPTQGGN